MIVVDTTVWVDFLNGVRSAEVERLLALLGKEPIVVGDLILLEVLRGIPDEKQAAVAEDALRRFDVAAMLDPGLAAVAAAHDRSLRRLGITVRRTIDLIICSFCIAWDLPLLTSERAFAPMAEHLGLRLA
jgi:predicted nucleic acid-binding protein